MLKLNKRPCQIGNSMSTNTEKHGDDDVGAIDLKLDGMMLNAAELDSLLGDGAHAAIYHRQKSNGKGSDELAEIRFPHLKPLQFKDDFEKSRVELHVGIDNEQIVLADSKVRRVTLTPNAGGLTTMACSVRSTPDSDTVAALYDHLNSEGSVAIRSGKLVEKQADKQRDLSLGEGEEAAAPA